MGVPLLHGKLTRNCALWEKEADTCFQGMACAHIHPMIILILLVLVQLYLDHH